MIGVEGGGGHIVGPTLPEGTLILTYDHRRLQGGQLLNLFDSP